MDRTIVFMADVVLARAAVEAPAVVRPGRPAAQVFRDPRRVPNDRRVVPSVGTSPVRDRFRPQSYESAAESSRTLRRDQPVGRRHANFSARLDPDDIPVG
jgi:hypothetical protein